MFKAIMDKKKITIKLKNHDEIEQLYETSFPVIQKMPFSILIFISHRKNAEFVAFYDNEEFVGFALYLVYKELIYVLYLAVVDSKRCQGYGSKILTSIEEQPNKTIVLNVEKEIDENDPEYEHKTHFFSKNGFVKSNLKIVAEKNSFYDMYVKGEPIDKKQFQKIISHFTYGMKNLKFIESKN